MSIKVGKAYAGDQEDNSVLSQIVDDAKAFSGFDIIVDDGSHKADKMLASLRVRTALALPWQPAALPACT